MLVDPKSLTPYRELFIARKEFLTNEAFYSMWQRLLGHHNEQRIIDAYSGLLIDSRWESFKNFLEDMGPRQHRKLTLDRIDSTLGYFKDNCRWATAAVQNRNRKSSIWIYDQEETLVLKDMCRKYKLNYTAVRARYIQNGWTLDEALSNSTKVRAHKRERKSLGKFSFATKEQIAGAIRGLRSLETTEL